MRRPSPDVPRFAANLTMLWQELDPYDRFEAAAEAGFTHVEMLFPHELNADRLAVTLNRFGLEMVVFDPAAGDWAAGERGLLALPGLEDEFLVTVHEAIDLATRIGTSRLNALVGIPPPGVGSDQAIATAIANLTRIAPLVRDAGITLLIEAINNVDMPGYWASTVGRAAHLVEVANHPSVRLQLDQYHAAMAGEDAIACLREHFRWWRTFRSPTCPVGTSRERDRNLSEPSWTNWIVSGTRGLSASNTARSWIPRPASSG
jgi:hydroxypyruvate isomerase